MTLLIIFCLLILYNFIKGTFQFESVTKTSFIIIPIYALVMTIISKIGRASCRERVYVLV